MIYMFFSCVNFLFQRSVMQVVVNAKKNAGGGLQGGYGNKVKLDPIVLALMEKRVAEQVEIERKKLMSQFQHSSGGAGDGDAMTAEQLQELEALRKRVDELDSRSKALVWMRCSLQCYGAKAVLDQRKASLCSEHSSVQDAGVARLPSEVESEMLRLRQEVERSRLKEIELEEARLAAEQRLQAAAVRVVQFMHRGKIGCADMCTSSLVSKLQQPGPDVPTLDDSVEAFMKLRDLQPQQQELQRSLDEDGGLNDEDAECLDFINDEIARLLDILQKHGFHFPECDFVVVLLEGLHVNGLRDPEVASEHLLHTA